ncbi:Predicted arabinose efflux permease, MFS family [Micromonospora phaseoli]|uniref:Predicted arabinose efflux permease, MFS family n=1 Tax=Micromonospora phaseoli TaxID=1144548 RepID=A0A1H6SH02_9ACTN|nr:MFS transporter [Micromonospora phaseoli]PZW03817.1 putative MFS family arabinose efflux permease [Micromonospora phaseoli]GIJ79119.1 MFS transporter [Micromonospora phaseoli]SEI63330.1 Predicted arabinose efflux permease, MFS family [Micromonospora phaseoli]
MRALVSARLGADFAKLWTASAVSNVGDGVTMAAGPLLVASISRDPALVAGAAFVQQLPWLLFALFSGAYVDRLDRRRLVVAVNLARAVALAGLAGTIATGTVTVAVIYAVVFLLGTGETLADTAMGAMLPSVVAPDRLPNANARLYASFTIGNQFVAKPLGAWLFVISAAAPFGLNALTFAVAAALLAGIRPTSAPEPRPRTSLRGDIAEGVRWLWRHHLLRTLAVSMGLANVAFCAAFAVFVLYCQQRLGLSAVGYGFLLTAFAAGGLVGTAIAARLTRAVGNPVVLRTGLVIEVATHLVLAVTTTPWVAAAALIVFSVHGMVWGVTVASLRQRLVPSHLLGRVGSTYALLDLGGAALGSLLGGLLASTWAITTPFWIAAAMMAVVAVCAWRPLVRAAV